MTIYCVCPSCQVRFPIEGGIADAAARQAVAQVAKLPAPLGDLVVAYFGLFAARGKATAWPKVARLAAEMNDLIRADAVAFGARRYPVSPQLWKLGLETILERRDRIDLPLKNHRYLLSIIEPEAERLARREAAEREQQEEQRRQHRRGGDGGPSTVGDVLRRATAARNATNAARELIGEVPRDQES